MVRNLTKYEVLIPFTSFESFHLRELGRFFGKHHYTVHRHLSALIQENILFVEKKGKEKIFRLNLNSPLTINYLEIAENIKLISFINNLPTNLKSLFFDILSLNNCDMCVLFGSYAKGSYDEYSDVDILIIPAYQNLKDVRSELRKIEKRWGVVISPICLTLQDFRANLMEKNETIAEIKKNHICIVGAEKFLKEVARWT